MTMPRVFISDKLETGGLELLQQASMELDNRPGLKGDELKQALQAAEGMIVRSGTKVTAELLDRPGKLRAIVRAGVGLDMKVVGYDPFLAPERAAQLGIEAAPDLDSLLPRADFLTVHTPLTAETTNLIGARELELMKKGSRVINCARGGIINEEALAAALTSGQLA